MNLLGNAEAWEHGDVTVDVVDNVEVGAFKLLLQAVKILTIALKVLHLRNDQAIHT